MAALTDQKVTAYSTVSSIDADLAIAEKDYSSLEEELEALLESGKATMASVAELEARVEAARHTRDELKETREFLINRQRWQAEKDAAGLLYTIVLCKWSPDEGGIRSGSDVTDYTTSLFTANEMNGVTGVIYLLQGWFAIYLEGPPAIINRMCREFKSDRKRFSLVVIVEKDDLAQNAFPIESENSEIKFNATTNNSNNVPSKNFNARAAIAEEAAHFRHHEHEHTKSTSAGARDGALVSGSSKVRETCAPRRRYTNESLRIVHVEDTPEPLDELVHHPETIVLREVALMMNLFAFVPDFNAANRGKGRFETSKGTNLLVKNDPSCSAIGGLQASFSHLNPTTSDKLKRAAPTPLAAGQSRSLVPPSGSGPAPSSAATKPDGLSPFPMIKRAVALISPYGDLWEAAATKRTEAAITTSSRQGTLEEMEGSGSVTAANHLHNGEAIRPAPVPAQAIVDDELISKLFKKVYEKAEAFLVDRDQRSFAAGLCGPHTQDGLYIVIDSGNMSYTIDVMTDFLAELNKDEEIREFYKPLLVLDHSPDVGLIVNGVCSIVGPIMRQLRKLATVARQEVIPFVTSYRVADLADRNGCHSVGVFMIDKDPAELFTHVTQLGKIGHYAGAEAVARMRAKADESQKAVDGHIEGPGEIERGCENFGIRPANDTEKKSLFAANDRAKRQAAFERGSGTSNYYAAGTRDAPRPPSHDLSSTRTVISVLNDPTSLSGLTSIKSLTTDYRGQSVMKDEAAVRPAGSGLKAALAKRAGGEGNNTAERDRGAHAARVVQTVTYFTPKGIQGDEEFRSMYDSLPQAPGGPGGKPCATRNGFDRFYYSLEHFGTDPTPATVDDLLGKTVYPNHVTFEQFSMVMNAYQRM